MRGFDDKNPSTMSTVSLHHSIGLEETVRSLDLRIGAVIVLDPQAPCSRRGASSRHHNGRMGLQDHS